MKTRIKQTKWLIIRIVFVSTGIVQGLRFSYSDIPSTFPSIWLVSIFTLVVIPILYYAVVTINIKFGLMDKIWYPPQWHRNPFTLRQPFQLFHMIAWQSIVTGLVIFLRSPWIGQSVISQAFLNFSFGASILIGIRIIINSNQDRMASVA